MKYNRDFVQSEATHLQLRGVMGKIFVHHFFNATVRPFLQAMDLLSRLS